MRSLRAVQSWLIVVSSADYRTRLTASFRESGRVYDPARPTPIV
jgi:hypothetical protein